MLSTASVLARMEAASFLRQFEFCEAKYREHVKRYSGQPEQLLIKPQKHLLQVKGLTKNKTSNSK